MQKYIFVAGLLGTLLMGGCGSPIPPDLQSAYQELPEKVDFNFHIRPILADRCFSCHGPDEKAREAGLRLDMEEAAFARLIESGNRALVKGSLSRSAVWNRITHSDPAQLMPPPESNLSLSQTEIALVGKWIEQGAEWKKHWAFIPPNKPQVPALPEDLDPVEGYSPRNPIDHFILAKLGEMGLQPSPEAPRERLIRRLYMDLTGLPPHLEAVEQFLMDEDPQAYERLVDHILQTNAFAERMAMDWMDVARYADSHGMHADGYREMWPWRDWVIEAFAKNLPYDDFVTWQLAGDLLPQATREQKLASAFQRNQPMNSELGIVTEEYRLKYVEDRTNTTAKAFMGLTMECAACHDHKFDPISQKEYYQLSAFFNNLDELGMIGNDRNFGPMLLLPEPEIEGKIARISQEIDRLEREQSLKKEEIQDLEEFIRTVDSQGVPLPEPDGFYPLNTLDEIKTSKGNKERVLDGNPQAFVRGKPELLPGKFGQGIRLDSDYDLIFLKGLGNFDTHEPFSASVWIKPEVKGRFQTIMGNIGSKNAGWRGWVMYLDTLNRPAMKIVHSLSHNLIHLVAFDSVPVNEWTHISFTYDGSARAGGLHLFKNGSPLELTVFKDHLYKNIRPVKGRGYVPDPGRSIMLGKGQSYLYCDTDDGAFEGSYDQIRLFQQALTPLEISQLYREDSQEALPSSSPPPSFYATQYLYRHDLTYQQNQKKLRELRKQRYELLDQVPEIMVQEEMATPRKTYLLERGQYDSPGEEVFPATPSYLSPFSESLPPNRLGLSQWLFDEKHPLTARVAVNHYWQLLFGEGLVKTPHDFGTQGALPTHPQLLDWLALSFRESGWDVKKLLKLMVSSATYRQSSASTPEQMAIDPQNRYLSKGASYRLPFEMIRDNVLAVSNLMDSTIGGPSVKPYQPEGLWKEKNEFSDVLKTYVPDSGSSLYRRSLYTFIRRTSPPPAMTAFDLPQRDVCIVKREKTNTPLQALILMNDPQFVEAARILAERIQREGGTSSGQKISMAFHLICGREPSTQEKSLLQTQYRQAFQKFRQHPETAMALLEVGAAPSDPSLEKSETAAWTMVTNTIMNFDEAYMKR